MATLNPDGTFDFRSDAQRSFDQTKNDLLRRAMQHAFEALSKPSPVQDLLRPKIVLPDGSPARPPVIGTIRFGRRSLLLSTD